VSFEDAIFQFIISFHVFFSLLEHIACGLLIQTSHIAWSVSVCVCSCVLDRPVSPAKTAEPIEMPFGKRSRLVLAEGTTHEGIRWGARDWCNLANTIERFLRGGNAALCSNTVVARKGSWLSYS